MECALSLTCLGLDGAGRFLPEHTGRGADRSPAFALRGLSPRAETLALTLEDVDHPIFRKFTHWLIWNLPAGEEIGAGIPAGGRLPALGGAVQGMGYGWHRYAGPKPPKGRTHRYRFTVYALDAPLPLGPNTTKRRFLRAAEGHILQRAEVTGYFE